MRFALICGSSWLFFIKQNKKPGRFYMKLLLFCLMSLSMISVLCARDITTLDGATYKNVTITNSSPVGITISYDKADGTMVIRGLDFRDLPADIQKEFNYTEVRANEFEKHSMEYRDMMYKEGLKKAAVNAAVEKQEEEVSKQIDHIQAFLCSKRKYIRFNCIRAHKSGLIGYANAADRTLVYGNYGKIFLDGLGGSNGTCWTGYIYPTDRTVTTSDGTYQVFNSSLEQATAEVMNALKQQ
jgi:hypothetical protein